MGECVKFFRSGWVKAALASIGIVFAAGGIWATLGAELNTTTKRSIENRESIDNMDKKLNTLDKTQGLILQQMENDQQNNARFQVQTGVQLDRILEEIKEINRSRWSDPR